jgi:hypothetical protein
MPYQYAAPAGSRWTGSGETCVSPIYLLQVKERNFRRTSILRLTTDYDKRSLGICTLANHDERFQANNLPVDALNVIVHRHGQLVSALGAAPL